MSSANFFIFVFVFVFILDIQGINSFTDIVVTGSSGATTFGLALGNHLNQCNMK